MILADVNLLLHAHNPASQFHSVAREWLSDALSGPRPMAFAWVTLIGYVRLSTNKHVMTKPLTVDVAEADVRRWLARKNAVVLHPTERHVDIFFRFLSVAGTGGNITTDAHLAALAFEHGAELFSADADFSRFPGVRWTNPLAP